jgi:uncharacterized HAD superfamily protein
MEESRMAKRLKIGVDVDGVLADFTGGARQILKDHLGIDTTGRTQTGWGFDSIGVDKATERKLWDYIDDYKDWWYNCLQPLPNCNLITTLCEKHQVIFITNRKHATEASGSMPVNEQTAFWLRQWFNIPNPTVLLSDNKGPLCAALGLDLFIDDRDKNLTEVIAAIGEDKVVGLEASYTPKELRQSHPKWVLNFNEFAITYLDRIEPKYAAYAIGRNDFTLNGRCIV